MLAELRTKSQITLPKSIVSSFGLTEGDKLEVFEKDGVICMVPVAVYPKAYLAGLQSEISQLKKDISSGKQPVFDNIDSMLAALEK